MKGTIAYITRNIKPRLTEKGFKKEKYCFVKNLDKNYKLDFFIRSVNFIEFQDIEISFYLQNHGKLRVMEFLNEIYYNEPNSSILSFKFTQFDKMSDSFLGAFNNDKYWISNEEEANIFISDLNQFFDKTIFSEKINELTDIKIVEKLINEPDVFTSSVVKDVDYRRFYDGLIFSKLSHKENLDKVFDKYINYTKGWESEAKYKIENLYQKLKILDVSEIDKLYYEK